jgi:hypothetical protein
MKKAALGLTLALTMSTAIACAPANDEGATGDTTYRGAGQTQDGTQTGFRGAGNNDNRDGIMGRGNRGGNGTFGNDNGGMGTFGTDNRGDGLFGNRDMNANRGGAGMRGYGTGYGNSGAGYGRDTVDRGTTDFGRNGRGGGFLYGGAGPRMNGARDYGMGTGLNRGDMNGTQRFGYGAYDDNIARNLERRVLTIPGVRDARVVINQNDIIVGVDVNGREDNVIRQVRQEIREEARGKNVHVTTDSDIFGRLGNGNNVGNILNDLGRNGNTGRTGTNGRTGATNSPR